MSITFFPLVERDRKRSSVDAAQAQRVSKMAAVGVRSFSPIAIVGLIGGEVWMSLKERGAAILQRLNRKLVRLAR